MKIGCECFEYDSIIYASIGTLRKYSKSAIEYHYRYLPLKERFDKAGFDLKIAPAGEPWYNTATHTVMTTGMIYASKRECALEEPQFP